ncbi:MAG TPA: DUF2924 domain-containing protein [Terriglobales bacterium]|nr:DUF2924 domain-containing protein [Terriglobales bacterium]
MADSLAQKIATLPGLSKAQLLPLWAENFTTPPPPKLRKQLMVPILAYRMQEREFGGLSHSARRRLQEIARTLPGKGGRRLETSSAPPTGTKLIRVWRGQPYEVLATDEGYYYEGQRYSSLSKIAKVITGTHWSGPAFFGTKGKPK